MDVIHKEALCINCGCCVSECNAMESDPEFLGPQALAKGMRFVGDPRDGATVERLEQYSERARHLGLHALLLLQRALPEGRRPARRDREARRRGDRARHRPRHGREAREVVRPLDRDDRLAARDGARAEDAGLRRRDQADEVRDEPRAHGKVRRVPAARREGRRRGARTSTSSCASRIATARSGTCRASARSSGSRTGTRRRRDARGDLRAAERRAEAMATRSGGGSSDVSARKSR